MEMHLETQKHKKHKKPKKHKKQKKHKKHKKPNVEAHYADLTRVCHSVPQHWVFWVFWVFLVFFVFCVFLVFCVSRCISIAKWTISRKWLHFQYKINDFLKMIVFSIQNKWFLENDCISIIKWIIFWKWLHFH